MDANLRFDHQLLAVESEHAVHCMLELDVPAAPDTARAPLRIALVVDRSGSMAGEKLEVGTTRRAARCRSRRSRSTSSYPAPRVPAS